MKSKYVFTQQIKEMVKICFNTLKIIVVKYGEIWFPWRNMVLCSTAISDMTVIRFWLHMMKKHPYCEKHSLSLQTRPVIHFATIYDRLSLTYESRMTILSSTLNRIESRRFISEKISAELDI